MKTDIYETITNRMITLLEKGVEEYQLPWRQLTKFEFPKNAVTKNVYKGINVLSLWCEEVDRGYSSGLWGTYNQWKSLGAQVRKNEKATPIVFWKSLPNDSDEKEKTASKPLIVSHSSVFNAEQVDGLEVKQEEEEGRINSVEEFFSNVGADIRHGGNEAFYSVTRDYVYMPFFKSFESAEDYYSILCHELTHWTGGVSRLNRDLSKRFGTEAYALEELIAELGSAFLSAELGLAEDPRKEHAQYLSVWLKVLKEDKKAIFTAASKAQAAADFLREQVALKMAA